MFRVDSVERGGETVGVAFAPLLAVGDDGKPGALLVANGQDGGVVLRGFKLVRRDPPEIFGANARHVFRQSFPIDQPIRLRIRADKGGRNEHGSIIT